MKNSIFATGVLATLLISAAGILPAAAQLPALNDPPWLGYYAAFENKRFKFGIAADGKITLTPIGDKGEPVSHTLAVPLSVGIEEVLPDGKTTLKQLKPETLESAQGPSDNLVKTVIKGKVTGDASFETTIEQTRGVIMIGGRVLDPGTLKNPLRFTVRVKFPNAYEKEKREDKKAEKAFEKKIGDDRIEIKWTDGKRTKQTFEDAVDASSKELNGPGIAAAEVEITAYKGKRFQLFASPNSAMTLWNGKSAPLHEGFSVNWLPDPAKDKEGKARLSIEVK